MYGRILILFVLFLSGCQTIERVRVETVRVDVPVTVPCKTPEPESPKFNIGNIKEDDNIFDKVKVLLSDINLHKSYQTELLAAFRSCK